jgi:alkylated DNA nucleotide flippase Atl1
VLAQPVTLAQAGLKERSDLQEWIRAHPQVLGRGVRIVTYEFDKWLSASGARADRLDLLGLAEDGRLVLAELKRDGAPETVEMQAVKYAAYASRFGLETLAACHGHYLRSTVDPDITDEEALARLEEHCGGLDPELLKSPRIVLVAGSFPDSVTAAVVWLCEQGLDVALVQIGAYQCENDLVITVDQIWPLPQVEDFTVSPVAPTAKPSTSKAKRKTTTAVALLAEEGVIADGTELHIVPAGTHADAIAAWVTADPLRGKALWRTGEKVRALEWLGDGQRYSASGLAELIIREAAGAPATVNGAEWWALDDGSTLAALAGFAPARKDWGLLHRLLEHVGAGEWTTYGELAGAVDSHPIAVGQHIAACADCVNAWRVLGADGHPRPNFAWSDPNETRSCRQVLEDEGVGFTGTGAADPARRVTGSELAAR